MEEANIIMNFIAKTKTGLLKSFRHGNGNGTV
ncbi:MAG: hypothetical protein QG657_5928 [Acidobacteriota bacterium]|nr:hypothetical protein [Acidobacteriota bacterium]